MGSAESEDTRLSDREIIFEDCQPMWSRSTDRRTDGQTVRRLGNKAIVYSNNDR